MRARLLYMNEVRLKEVTDSSARRRDDFVPRPEGGSPFVGYSSGPSRRPPAYDREEDEIECSNSQCQQRVPSYHPLTIRQQRHVLLQRIGYKHRLYPLLLTNPRIENITVLDLVF
ncbi:hypothetical protein ONZ45_g14997 [Pleurotus djamor]|nr:hypothetical protein ONZ45_g14997 [Pleurotus djamor]